MREWLKSTHIALGFFLVLKAVYVGFLLWNIQLGAKTYFENYDTWILYYILTAFFVFETIRVIVFGSLFLYLKCKKKLKISEIRDLVMNQTVSKRLSDRMRA